MVRGLLAGTGEGNKDGRGGAGITWKGGLLEGRLLSLVVLHLGPAEFKWA